MSAITVLVVDDDEDIRIVTRISLERVAGWQVLEAADGGTAVEIARREHPDVVLLDMMMPGMDGLATYDALQADPCTEAVPVVLFTAKRSTSGAPLWGDRRIRGVIAKPFDPLGLPDQLTRLLTSTVEMPASHAV